MPPARLTRPTLQALALNLLPILTSFGLLLFYSRGVPMFDDYHAILFFLFQFRAAPTLAQKFLLLFTAQHNEYKLILEHFFVAGQYLLTGNVHFSFLIWAGNLFVLGIGWLVWQNAFPATQPLATRLLLFAPVTFLLFQLNYVETQDWAMCGLQTFPAMFFVLAAIHFLVQPGRFALACLCAVLACFSSIHAFLLAPVGFLMLLLRVRVERRAWLRLALWTATFAATTALYLYRYQRSTLTNPNSTLSAKGLFFVSFLGASVENMHRFPVPGGAIVLGTLLLLALGYALRSGALRTQPFFVFATLWILLTTALVAYGRSGLGLNASLTSRYKIYSDLLLSFAYIHLATLVLNRRQTTPSAVSPRLLYAAGLSFAVLLSISSDAFGARALSNRRARCEQGFQQYFADPAHNPPMVSLTDSPIAGPEPEFTRIVLTQALQQHLFTYTPLR